MPSLRHTHYQSHTKAHACPHQVDSVASDTHRTGADTHETGNKAETRGACSINLAKEDQRGPHPRGTHNTRTYKAPPARKEGQVFSHGGGDKPPTFHNTGSLRGSQEPEIKHALLGTTHA